MFSLKGEGHWDYWKIFFIMGIWDDGSWEYRHVQVNYYIDLLFLFLSKHRFLLSRTLRWFGNDNVNASHVMIVKHFKPAYNIWIYQGGYFASHDNKEVY